RSKRDWSSDVCSSDLLADNTFGDMISDQAGSVVGTLGVLPSASLNGIPGGSSTRSLGLYEPTHGSAPTYAFPFLLLSPSKNTIRSEERRVGNESVTMS